MAIFIPSGGIVAQINGRVGDKVYYRGRYGETVRNWVYPNKTLSPRRTAVWNLFKSLNSLYNSLTPAMQDDWNIYANNISKFNRLAQPYIPTGLQLFLERNINLSLLSLMPILLPPDNDLIIPITSFHITSPSHTQLLIYATFFNNLSSHTPAHHWMRIYATDQRPPSVHSMTNRYLIIATSVPLNPLPQNMHFNWTAIYGSVLIPGNKIFFKIVLINDNTGEASNPVFSSITAV